MILRSPVTGAMLSREGHALFAGAERWPVVDNIAFLRADRRELADAALRHLDAGDHDAALVCLLGDQDGWATTPPPSERARREVVRRRDEISFREAMSLLAFGPVATYFTHRWSDPTFLSGLALAQAFSGERNGSSSKPILEVACGAGHYLRAFGSDATGGDLVFAKLWLARHFVSPTAQLICFDASVTWPFQDNSAVTVFCHDAFYFLPNKAFVAAEMMRVGRQVIVGHMHNALTDNLSAGAPLTPAEYIALFPGCLAFDDAELTSALVEARVPSIRIAAQLENAKAIAVAWNVGAPDCAAGYLTNPPAGAPMRRNPLYREGRVVWPSVRYEQEYARLVTYPEVCNAPEMAVAGADSHVDDLARRRVYLDLPARW